MDYLASLAQARQRLDGMEAMLKGNGTPPSLAASSQFDGLMDMISKALKQELAPLMEGLNVNAQLPTMAAGFLDIIGNAFTQQQQEWISVNKLHIPGFFQSDAGKTALQLMFEEFQSYMKGK